MSEEFEWQGWDYDKPVGWIDGSILMKSTHEYGDGEFFIAEDGTTLRVLYGVWVGVESDLGSKKRIIIYELEVVGNE